MYRLDGQVCLKFGVVDSLFKFKMVDNTKFNSKLKIGRPFVAKKTGQQRQIQEKLDRPYVSM